MFALLFALLTLLAGWSLVRLFPLQLRRGEALAMSFVVGAPLAGWTAFIFAGLFQFPAGLPLTFLVLGLISATQLFVRSRAALHSEPYSRRFRVFSCTAAIAIAFIVGRLIFLSYQLPTPEGNWMSNGNAWGDAPLHITYANQFSLGDRLDLVSPSYQKSALTYPFMSDFYSGMLLRLGANWNAALFLPSLAIALSLLYLIFSFGYRLLGSARAAWIQLVLLVFSGAVHGGWELTKIIFTQGFEAYHTFVGVSIPLSTGDNYLNFIHSHIIPQRGYAFGMALVLVILSVFLHSYRTITKKAWLTFADIRTAKNFRALFTPVARRAWFSSATLPLIICIGMLPLLHTHSFFVLVGLTGLATLALLITQQRLPKMWIPTFIGGFGLALPQALWQFRSSYDSHFHSWIQGWIMKDFSIVSGNLFTFWLGQIGILFIVILLGWWLLRRLKAPVELWFFYLAGVCIFAVCNVYVFQPSPWDNMKFFEYALWFMMMVLGFVLATWSHRRWTWIGIAPAILSLTIMGWYTLVLTGPELTYELLSAKEVSFGTSLRTTLPQDAYVLIGNRHNHPVTMLSGRKVLITYTGWYNLYNDQWPIVDQDRITMLEGKSGTEDLLAHYQLTHVIFSDSEVASKLANQEYYATHYQLVTYQDGWWIYDVRTPLLGS